jgi:hypothetical protein
MVGKIFTKEFRITLSMVSGILAGLIIFTPQPVTAFDWMKTGKDILQKSTTGQSTSIGGLTDSEIGAGLRDALKVGTERVVGQLGQSDGFNADPEIHIPLPENFQKVRSVLGSIGQSAMLDDLELKLNRAAEKATPQAKQLFWDSIKEMTVDDVNQIYSGPEDAATRYFQGKMSSPLTEAMKPIVSDSMAEVGAVQAYDAVMGQYSSIPFVPDVKSDLTTYVVDKGMDGIFFYLAKEEAAIRSNPVKRTTEILQKVFGAK